MIFFLKNLIWFLIIIFYIIERIELKDRESKKNNKENRWQFQMLYVNFTLVPHLFYLIDNRSL